MSATRWAKQVGTHGWGMGWPRVRYQRLTKTRSPHARKAGRPRLTEAGWRAEGVSAQCCSVLHPTASCLLMTLAGESWLSFTVFPYSKIAIVKNNCFGSSLLFREKLQVENLFILTHLRVSRLITSEYCGHFLLHTQNKTTESVKLTPTH